MWAPEVELARKWTANLSMKRQYFLSIEDSSSKYNDVWEYLKKAILSPILFNIFTHYIFVGNCGFALLVDNTDIHTQEKTLSCFTAIFMSP